MKRYAGALVALLLLVPAREAAADFFINPFVGTTLSSPSTSGSRSQAGFGIALGSARSFFGSETEIAYYPELLDNSANGLGKSKVVTFFGNTLIGPTIGPIKVYGAAGVGGVYLNVSSAASLVNPTPSSITNNYFGVNVGGGAMGDLSSPFAVRADLRYFRAFGFSATDLEGAGTLKLDKFDFWRANIGLVVRF